MVTIYMHTKFAIIYLAFLASSSSLMTSGRRFQPQETEVEIILLRVPFCIGCGMFPLARDRVEGPDSELFNS